MSSREGSQLDPKAVKILFNRYWSTKGWKKDKELSTSASDLAYAKQCGVMFDPIHITHDESVARAISIREKVSRHIISNAFLASLSTRRLDWRSALGSYCTIWNLPRHQFTLEAGRNRFSCAVCGIYETTAETNISVLNFERLKWGGVRHSNPLYAALDLEWLLNKPAPAQTANDFKIFRAILERVSLLPSDARPGDAEKALRDVIASNINERRTLIQILGYAGLMAPKGLPTYWKGYPKVSDRKDHSNSKNDWSYPVLWWRGSDGIDVDALKFLFPEFHSPKLQ